MNVLECSSKGDKRFSALYAKVTVGNQFRSIEEHYQLAKRIKGEDGRTYIPETLKDAKRKMPVCFVVNGKIYESRFLSDYYSLLWVKYLDTNPSIATYARQFDDFNDTFKGKSRNCQADVISRYVKEGRASIIAGCSEFSNIMKDKTRVIHMNGNLLTSNVDIRGHQTNCLGIMGGGIAAEIKKLSPSVYSQYKDYCEQNDKSRVMMGKCYITKSIETNKYVANLFGQFDISKNEKKTEEPYLKLALEQLKRYAMINHLSVGLPFQLGSGLAGGNWTEILEIITEVFDKYPVYIYKLPEK